MINIHHLELFYYAARAGGITAALRLIPYGIQQPAVSAQIGRLEESLGVKLFHRRPFSLTPAGREVYEQVAPFFSNLSQLARRVRQDAQQRLRLAASASALREEMPELLQRLDRATPGLEVTLREATQPVAERMLLAHEIDLAVVLLESKPAAGVRAEPLLRLPLVLLVAVDSPFRTAAEVLRVAVRDELPLVSLARSEHLAQVFQRELASRKIVWKTRIEASGTDLIEAYVGHGFGVGVALEVPGRVPAAKVRALRLRGFPLVVFGALWSGRLPAPASAFLDLARERARALAGG
ncbi:MAG: LysR family transcriptional regulator [Chthoniobacter sp.]|nr:LysR family transcriptional regulator [Chthoniobacter sp.]